MANATRTRVTSSYKPYNHENTHVFLPDGSHHVVEKSSSTRSSQDYNKEILSLVSPWEKQSVLDQAKLQKSEEWKMVFGNEQPLDKGGIRTSNRDNPKNWDTFEISFDRKDILGGTPEENKQRQKDVFNDIVDWAKTVKTEGLEGSIRAFTIQEWHSLDGSSARPHLRLEMQRLAWDPTQIPKLTPTQNGKNILSGKVQNRMNYTNESGETDKDFDALRTTLMKKYNIVMEVGAPSKDRSVETAQQSKAPDRSKIRDEIAALENKQQNPSDNIVFVSEKIEKPFQNRAPQDPDELLVAAKYEAAKKALEEYETIRLAQLQKVENKQLREDLHETKTQLNDTTIEAKRLNKQVAIQTNVIDVQSNGLKKANKKMVASFKHSNRLQQRNEALQKNLKDFQDRNKQNKALYLKERYDHRQTKTELDRVAPFEQQYTEEKQMRVAVTKSNEVLMDQVNQYKNNLVSKENMSLDGVRQDLATKNQALKQDIAKEQEVNKDLANILDLGKENTQLKEKVTTLQQENDVLEKEYKKEQDRLFSMKNLHKIDVNILDTKVDDQQKRFDDVAEHLRKQGDLEAIKMIEAIRNIIVPRDQYQSRVEAWQEVGAPPLKTETPRNTEEEQQHAAFGEKFKELQQGDDKYSQEAKKRAAQEKQAVPMKKPVPKNPAAEKDKGIDI